MCPGSAGTWILDEPTSAIDAEHDVFAELQANRQNRITIVVSHRWSLRGMDRIHVFNDGHIVQTGTYDELLPRGRFAELFADQVP